MVRMAQHLGLCKRLTLLSQFRWWGKAAKWQIMKSSYYDGRRGCYISLHLELSMMFVFSPFFSSLRGCLGHGTEAESTPLCPFSFTNYLHIHISLQLKCWVSGMQLFGPAASSLLDGQAHCWGWRQPDIPAGRWNAPASRKRGCQ